MPEPGSETDRLNHLLTITEALNNVRDLDSLLDRILLEARRIANADAGTIFLVQNGALTFSYTQNDTLFTGGLSDNKYLYQNLTLPIDHFSISGHVAVAGEAVVHDDVYELGNNHPYTFDPSWDDKSGYRTQSMLTVPLKTSQEKVVGVMQIINAKNHAGRTVAFSETDRLYVSLFANASAVAVDRGIMTREIILRMIRMAELRDPKETGAHVNRVAAYSIEIYQEWARAHGVDPAEVRRIRDILRIAAMLHDVGKVAIPDAVLKKPGKLTDVEYALMQTHTVIGARLFGDPSSETDALAAEIALTHHEKWNGRGYPGSVNIDDEPIGMGIGLRGEEIPIAGRIVGIADVYDALMSARAYKAAWKEEDVLELVRDESGQHFDPEIVDAFFAVYEVIKAVREKYIE